MDSEEYCHRPAGPKPRVSVLRASQKTTRVPKRLRMDRPQRDRPAEGLPQLGVLTKSLVNITKAKHQRRDEEEVKSRRPRAIRPPGWIFWSWGSRSAPGALLGGSGPPL